MILVIIIVAAWIVILAPSLMKRRSQGVGEIGSISHFHRQLRVLEHSGPQPIVTPAYRLRSVDGGGVTTQVPGGPEAPAPVLSVVGASQLPRPALAFLGDDPGAEPGRWPGAQPGQLGRSLSRALSRASGRSAPLGSDWSLTPPQGRSGRRRPCLPPPREPGHRAGWARATRASWSAGGGATPSP